MVVSSWLFDLLLQGVLEFSRQIAQDIAVQNSLILSEFERFMPSNMGMVSCFVSHIVLFFVFKI